MNCPNCGCDASAIILWPDDGTDGRRYWHPDSTACDVYMWDSDGYVLGAREAPARRPQR